METQAFAQPDAIEQAAFQNLVPLRHLRQGFETRVHRIERIVNQVAVTAGDEGRGPNRVEDLQVGMHDHPQGIRAGCRRRLRLS